MLNAQMTRDDHSLIEKMPNLHIDTNLPRSKIPADFFKKAIPLLAKTLDRDAELCVCSVSPDQVMSFGGSAEPCALAKVVAIDRLGPEQNIKYSKIFSDFVQEQLGIPSDRMYLTFKDEKKEDIGYKGTTFAQILK